jgi:Zn-finger nucleic acid-binding protein
MHCPFDGTDLQVVNRSGIEIDWCPSCKGVWLERGELDKLIDQTATSMAPSPGQAPMPAPAMAPAPMAAAPPPPRWGSPGSPDSPHWQQRRSPYPDPRGADDDGRYRDDDRYRSRKRKNLLSEIFDF